MKKRIILSGLSVGTAILALALGATLAGFGAARAPERSFAKPLARSANQSHNAPVITQMQTISERIGGSDETNALPQQGFPTLPSQVQPTVEAGTPVPTPAGGAEGSTIVFQDVFVDCANMAEGVTERYDYHCGLGEYWMIRKVTDGLGMSLIKGDFGDGTFAVDGRVSTFSSPAQYGLLFRISLDGSNGYGAGVYEGQYTIFRYDDGEFVRLVPLTANPNIKPGAETNHIQVAANGDQISLYVNGAHITTIVDNTHRSGGAGLYAYGEQLPIEAVFDNLTIAKFDQPVTLTPPAAAENATPTAPTAQATQSAAEPTATPTTPSSASQNPCQLEPGQAGFLISNSYPVVLRFTIGGGEWGTHEYDIPADGDLYLITFPPGRYTYTAFVPGYGTDHGEPYDYLAGYCRQIDYAP